MRVGAALLVSTGLLALVPAAGPAWAQTSPQGTGAQVAPAAEDLKLARVVRGIISYTRWPEEPDVLEVCLVGPLRYGQGLMTALPQTAGRALRMRPLAGIDAESMQGCQVAYIGDVSPAELRQLQTLRQPLLTIREQDPLCRSGSMFCLRMGEKRVSFDLNLDAVARSGLRVDPKVLLLGHRAGRP